MLADLKDKEYGFLTVIDRAEDTPGGRVRWNCKCKCGKIIPVLAGNLVRFHTTSCGCDRQHGLRECPEYRNWCAMRQRCHDKNHPAYRRHGARGVKVCERWNDFRNFLEDMGPRPSEKHTLDRFPNNDGDYEPGNVRWATMEEQAANKNCNRWLTIDGVRKLLTHWADENGINSATLNKRIALGWPQDKWFIPPDKTKRNKRAK